MSNEYYKIRPQIAKAWYKKGKASSDAMEKFIELWISFNALYCKMGDLGKLKEYQQIKAFVNEQGEEKYRSTLEVTDLFNERIIKNLHPIGSQPKDTTPEWKTLNSQTESDIKKLQDLFVCIYRARCNLFHGDKLPDDYNDLLIASESAKVLEHYLTIYFNAEEH